MSERIPLPLPVGWFCIGTSDSITPGEVRSLHYFGRELVLFRGDDGTAHILDAYCPHLGAHLGVGGTVEGGTIRCPFHGWRFNGEGVCVSIPYAQRIPPGAETRAWSVCERNGLVFVWYHPWDDAPTWEIPEVPEWGDGSWSEPIEREYRVRSHPQEMAENIVDPVHFHTVHGTPNTPEMAAEIDGHVFRARQNLTFTTPRGEAKGQVDIECHGCGFAVTRFRGVVETLLIVTGIPIDDELQLTTIRFCVKKIPGDEDATRNVGAAFVAEIERQYTQDIPIWENKRYLTNPLLCAEDGPIPLLRKYFRQFYPEPRA